MDDDDEYRYVRPGRGEPTVPEVVPMEELLAQRAAAAAWEDAGADAEEITATE